MKKLVTILSLFSLVFTSRQLRSQTVPSQLSINLYNDTVVLPFEASLSVPFNDLSDSSIAHFYHQLSQTAYQPLIAALTNYRNSHSLNDWLYYQLIRKTANVISPKVQNYHRYTLYKWFLLSQSGYDAGVRMISHNRLLFYVQSNDSIYNIPYQLVGGKQYVCLNYHDYGSINFEKEKAFQQLIRVPGANQAFSYRVNQLPLFTNASYVSKQLNFSYGGKDYNFKIKINPVVKDIFANYPVVDFESCFNIPLSSETYQTLIPDLKAVVSKMDERSGIDYLMHFTRYAFAFEKDADNFGKEKRLAPEETLLYEYSDCEDRSALFFYLVKELYNLPMITLLYPEHVTIAIQFSNPGGKTIVYKGRQYTVCEPTPQSEDLKIGQLPTSLRKAAYDVGYEYNPTQKRD